MNKITITKILGILSILGLLLTGIAVAFDIRADVKSNTKATADHEKRLRQVEPALTKIQTDVEWIRDQMERDGE